MSEKDNLDIEVIKLGANDETLLHQDSEMVIERGIVKYGKKDDQFDYLLQLYVGSVTHNAITDSLSNMIYGEGLNVQGIIDPKDNKKIIKDSQVYGNAVLQVTGTDIFHSATPNWRAAEADENGNILGYWFSSNWNDGRIQPKWFPAWFKGWEPTREFPSSIYWIKKYTPQPGVQYYGLPGYQGGLAYMEQEIEVAKFLNHYIKNNFSVTKIINFNNGVSDPEARRRMKIEIAKKLTGTEGEKTIVAFNKSKDHAASIEDVTVSNASEQYTYMTENARANIIVAHKITSPLLVGIRDTGSGLGSNSNEMLEARALLEEMVIRPEQELIADAYNEIKGTENIEFISSAQQVPDEVTEIERQEESLQLKKAQAQLADALIELGEDSPEGYNLVSSSPVDYETIEDDDYSLVENVELATTGTAIPNARSEQDSEDILIRYRYSGGGGGSTREFCLKMEAADKIYRKEDIERMGNNPSVNPGLGPFGTDTYSIWLYKGGANCYHQWFREIYVREGIDIDVNSPLARTISTAEARRRGYDVPTNNPLVAIKPINMPNQGYLNPR